MLYVKEMTEAQRQEIISAAESDGYTLFDASSAALFFKKGFREIKVLSTNIHDSEMGLEIDFNMEAYLQQNYQNKSRHTVSLRESIERHKSVEDACSAIRWQVVNVISLQNKNTDWQSSTWGEQIFAVKINDIDHVIVYLNDNYEVYEGSIAPIESMGKIHGDNILENTALGSTLGQLDQLNR